MSEEPFQIPSRFKLLGQTITVQMNPTLARDNDWTGASKYRTNVIEIQPSVAGCERTPDSIEHTFFHELIHFIFYFSGWSYEGREKNLHQDEALVDLTAGLLHQALSTMEWDD